MENKLVLEQEEPKKNDLPASWDMVIDDVRLMYVTMTDENVVKNLKAVVKDMTDRDAEGTRKYNTRLQPFNGRDQLIDGYQEGLDLAVYLRTKLYEIENSTKDYDDVANLQVIYFNHLDNLIALRMLIKL